MALNANTTLVVSHQRGGHALLRFNGTSANVQVWANSTVNADISTTNDQITGASITGLWWSVTGNTITLGRVVNSTVTSNVMVLSGTGSFDRNNGWPGGVELPSANVLVTYGTSGAGVLYLELAKEYAGGDNFIEHAPA